jgi:hypothetical protein
VEATSVFDPIAQLLLPTADLGDPGEATFGDRSTTVYDLGGQLVYVYPSGDVLWFVTTSLEDVGSMITALP